MNKQLHPELVDATIVCACGAEYKTRSVRIQLMWKYALTAILLYWKTA